MEPRCWQHVLVASQCVQLLALRDHQSGWNSVFESELMITLTTACLWETLIEDHPMEWLWVGSAME